jgi:hypothetical protein
VKLTRKQAFIDAAQVFDVWRVVPRFVLFGYCYWVAYVTDSTLSWYKHLPPAERTLEASGLAGAIITAVTGLLPWVYRIYSDNATAWDNGQTARTSTMVASTETINK